MEYLVIHLFTAVCKGTKDQCDEFVDRMIKKDHPAYAAKNFKVMSDEEWEKMNKEESE